MSRHSPLLLLFLIALACRGGDVGSPPSSDALQPEPAIPAAWAGLNLPSGILAISRDTDEHGFYADYRGSDRQALLDDVARRMVAAGYARSCTAEDGYVLGFTKGNHQLAVKVDSLPVLTLSVFDADGKEPLLHGLCFGRYYAGPPHVLDDREKEAFGRQFEDGIPPTASVSPAATSSPTRAPRPTLTGKHR